MAKREKLTGIVTVISPKELTIEVQGGIDLTIYEKVQVDSIFPMQVGDRVRLIGIKP